MCATVMKHFQEYFEIEDGTTVTATQPRRTAAAASGGSEGGNGGLLPLGETTLTHNLGLPVVVVLTKVRSGLYVLPNKVARLCC